MQIMLGYQLGISNLHMTCVNYKVVLNTTCLFHHKTYLDWGPRMEDQGPGPDHMGSGVPVYINVGRPLG